MALKTPFFHAFGPLLFGRAKAQVNRSLQDLKGLDDLYSVFGDLFPEKLLDPTTKGVNSRQRRLPPVVTFWAFVAQVLSPKTSCREIVHRIEVWWRWANVRSGVTLTSQAWCYARQRLSLETLRLINGQIAWTLERRVTKAEQPLPGREVKIVDGTGISMPEKGDRHLFLDSEKGDRHEWHQDKRRLRSVSSILFGVSAHFQRVMKRLVYSKISEVIRSDSGNGFAQTRAFPSETWQRGENPAFCPISS